MSFKVLEDDYIGSSIAKVWEDMVEDAKSSNGVSYGFDSGISTIISTPNYTKFILSDGNVIDYVEQNHPESYKEMKENLIKQSRFYEPPLKQVPSNFPDSDWD